MMLYPNHLASFLFPILRAAFMDSKPFISASELGPLLGEIGAFVPNNNNPCASMKALTALSQQQPLNLNGIPLV